MWRILIPYNVYTVCPWSRADQTCSRLLANQYSKHLSVVHCQSVRSAVDWCTCILHSFKRTSSVTSMAKKRKAKGRPKGDKAAAPSVSAAGSRKRQRQRQSQKQDQVPKVKAKTWALVGGLSFWRLKVDYMRVWVWSPQVGRTISAIFGKS